MTVARILANKGRSVVTTAPERTMQEVSVELMRYGIGALVVVDANDDIVGLEHYPSMPIQYRIQYHARDSHIMKSVRRV